jgi:hypothetical protein
MVGWNRERQVVVSAHDVQNCCCPEKTRASPKQMLLQKMKNAIAKMQILVKYVPGTARR